MREFPPLRLGDGEQAIVRLVSDRPNGDAKYLVQPLRVENKKLVHDGPVAQIVCGRSTLNSTGHADYPHEPGALYDCPVCEVWMKENRT